MGTRGSAGFIYQEEVKLGYNQFDSYPDGLGRDVLGIVSKINKEDGWEKLKNNVLKLKDIGRDTITDDELLKRYEKYSNLSVSEQKLSDPYCLFRSIQGSDWIDEVYSGNLEHYTLENNFVYDSLFCEYAYIINLDTMKLEFYDGYQKEVQVGNRFGESSNSDGYYPCRLVGVFSLLRILDTPDINDILLKMDQISESKQDDSSVINYFRKPKLEAISNIK
jgi:hypothetical protein